MATEKRLIDVNKFKHKIKLELLDRRNKFISLKDLCECIDDMPTVDAVEVVRCKDCKYYEKPYEGDCLGVCRSGRLAVSIFGEIYPEPDYYCPYGERKDN